MVAAKCSQLCKRRVRRIYASYREAAIPFIVQLLRCAFYHSTVGLRLGFSAGAKSAKRCPSYDPDRPRHKPCCRSLDQRGNLGCGRSLVSAYAAPCREPERIAQRSSVVVVEQPLATVVIPEPFPGGSLPARGTGGSRRRSRSCPLALPSRPSPPGGEGRARGQRGFHHGMLPERGRGEEKSSSLTGAWPGRGRGRDCGPAVQLCSAGQALCVGVASVSYRQSVRDRIHYWSSKAFMKFSHQVEADNRGNDEDGRRTYARARVA